MIFSYTHLPYSDHSCLNNPDKDSNESRARIVLDHIFYACLPVS